MKIYLVLTLILSFIMALSPLMSLALDRTAPQETEQVFQSIEQTVQESTEESETASESNTAIKVLRVNSGRVETVDMTDYVIGAVAAEIPPTYEEEAIKAQAVACYTYALWLKNNPDSSLSQNAEISDSSSHQNYCDKDELKDKWGEKFDSCYEKISSCVNAVAGEYLQHNGEPILACYHAISPGKTESARTVWGDDIPYLKSVTANGDILSPDFDSTVVLTEKEFKNKAEKLDDISLGKDSDKWVGKAEFSKTGFVKTMKIGKKEYDGNEIRTAFSLRSPYFTLKKENGKFVFAVKGSGHGLGMSQYSADYMARQGSSYKEILLHFYSGAELVKG